MPVRLDIVDFKCFNQLRNGQNFDQNLGESTPNLVGNIGEKVKVEYAVNVQQTAFTEAAEEWFIIVAPPFRQIERSSGSFLEDGIQVGDVYIFYPDWLNRRTGSGEYTGVVDFVSSDGKTLRYTLDTGTDSSVGTQTNVGLGFVLSGAPLGSFGGNLNTAAFLRFGLLSNDETFNFISKTTESQQVYYVGELVIGDPAKVAESLGSIKDWVTGEVSIEFTNNQPDFLGAQYIVSHEFILNPFYILSFREFIENGTIPELLAGDSSLKYAAELEFRKTLTDTIAPKLQSFDGLNGFVGWYGENFNGLNKKYQVVSVSYEAAGTNDPLGGININASTVATITVENVDAAITDYSCAVYLIRLPDSEDDYIGTETDLVENFLLKSEIVSSPATSTPNVQTSLVSGDLVIEYTIEYTVAQRLQLTTEEEYLLLVQIEDPTVSARNSDRVMLIADLNNYVDIDYVSQFLNVPTYQFLQHPQQLGDAGSQIQILSNEDGILLDAVIGADTTREVLINSLSIKLLAFNPSGNTSFDLDEYSFNLGEVLISGGVQQIEVDTTRGYPLPPGDEFNLARITTESQVGDFQQYAIQLGQKIKWQDWILNVGVDDVFFDASKPNNNLNEKASNYSNKLNYGIRMALVANVSGLDDLGRTVTGDFINYGTLLNVLDYDESDDGVTGVIQTFDLETGQSLEGNILYNGKDTLFKAIFQNAGAMQYGIHRIEPSQNQGDGILELSSIVPSVANNLLKPLDGQTQLSFDIVGSELTTQCIIDGALIQEGVSYKLSARVAKEPLVLSDPFTFTIDTTNAGGSANDQFQLPLIAGGSYDILVDKGNGDDLVAVTSAEDPNALLDYSGTGAGQYEVKMYGIIRGWSFGLTANLKDPLKILTVSTWGTFQPTGREVFSGCSNLNVTATDPLDLSQTNTLEAFFRSCTSLVFNSSIGLWDVSGITNLTSTFFNCDSFNQSINSWNVEAVISCQEMFQNSAIYNQPHDNWNLLSCTNISFMFANCNAFNAAVDGMNLPVVQLVRNCFASCNVFNQPLNNWNITTAVTSLESMFNNSPRFNQDLDNWDVSNVSNFFAMFRSSTDFNGNISSWVTSSATSFSQMFFGASNFNRNLNSWGVNLTNLLSCTSMFEAAQSYNQPMDNWDVSNVVGMAFMFSGTISFDQDITGWSPQNVTSMSNMFNNSLFNRNIGSWNIASLSTAQNMFRFNNNLSTPNLDALLNGWAAQAPSIQNNVVFDAPNTARSAASDAAVNLLTNTYLWTINTL